MCSGLLLRRVSSFRGSLARQRRIRTLVHLIAWCVACASTTGCGSTVATSTGPSPAKCGVTLTAPAASVASSGGTAAVSIGTQAECTWSASSEANWIAGLSPTSGQGAGELQLTVAANPDAAARQGNVLVNGVRAQIRQEAAPCNFDVSSTEQTFTASSGSGRINITAPAGCTWTARADSPWVTISSGTSGTGPGSVSFTVAANTGDARTASLAIADRTVRVAQAAALSVECSNSVTPQTISVTADGSNSEEISVNALPTCTWSASSSASWIAITGRNSGTGSGTISVSIASNTGAARNGTLTVAGQTIQVSQSSANCSFTVNPLTTSIAAAGGNGSPIAVQVTNGCTWTAVSNAAWLSITSGSSGSGNGSVGFIASANTGAARTGTLTIAGQTVTINQAAASSCTGTVNPTSVSVAAAGIANSSLSVSAASSCAWTAVSTVTWISIVSGSPDSGNGTVKFTVAANTTAAQRVGTLTVAGQIVTITQAASSSCTYTLDPTTLSVAAAGGAATPVSVTTAGGCAWTATPNVSWLSITSGASGAGNGMVKITAAANTGAARTGTVTVATETITVNQAAAPCSFGVLPTSASIGTTGGAGTPITVTTTSGCAWTASSGVSWISIATGASGTGSGAVTYSVQGNTGAARMGTLTVAGQPVTISQSACTYVVAPTSLTIDSPGGTGGPVSVTTQSSCVWTAVSNAPWITVTSGASGTGSGSVGFTVAANGGGQRTGTLTIAGATFTVTELKK